jgi:endonuclease YncB( thermonuclease family)
VPTGTHVRLFGIDAPELGQRCTDGWPAGDKAKGFLITLITGGLVVCDDRGKDKYGRTLGVCSANGTLLNQAMVRTGNALAYSQYSRDYVLDEIGARNAKAGMWAHNCQAPWDFRHNKEGKK